MKIILLKTHKGLGMAGEVVEAKEGYARNYLIPRKIAAAASKHAIDMVEAKKQKMIRQNKEYKRKKQQIAKTINRRSFKIEARANDKGSLYSGIGRSEISAFLKAADFDIEPGEIKLKKAVKKIGKENISLVLGGEKAKITVEVKKPRTD